MGALKKMVHGVHTKFAHLKVVQEKQFKAALKDGGSAINNARRLKARAQEASAKNKIQKAKLKKTLHGKHKQKKHKLLHRLAQAAKAKKLAGKLAAKAAKA